VKNIFIYKKREGRGEEGRGRQWSGDSNQQIMKHRKAKRLEKI
jgi:hypothetical protein